MIHTKNSSNHQNKPISVVCHDMSKPVTASASSAMRRCRDGTEEPVVKSRSAWSHGAPNRFVGPIFDDFFSDPKKTCFLRLFEELVSAHQKKERSKTSSLFLKNKVAPSRMFMVQKCRFFWSGKICLGPKKMDSNWSLDGCSHHFRFHSHGVPLGQEARQGRLVEQREADFTSLGRNKT